MAATRESLKYLNGQVLMSDQSITDPADNDRVFQSPNDGRKYIDISSQTYKTSIAKIRASQTLNPNITYITTDFGVPVEWQVDESDATSVDNTGTILVTADGVRLKARTKGVIDCRQFGIIPDGATPVGDALQSMINSLQNETIELHPGVYILDKKVTIPNNIGYDGIYAQTLDSLGQWGDMQLLFNPQSVNIAGTTVDLEQAFDFWKDITADLTLALSNASDGKKASISIRNTDTNPHTVTITGVSFPDGASNSIPAGGRAHISLQQINGVIDAKIFIYS